ncbi:MAG: glutamyl-tRNA reductase [Thiotrichaceae bacterium]
MPIIVVGVNHNTASIDIREKIAFSPDEIAQALEAVGSIAPERVILSTCNRTEFYVAGNDAKNLQALLIEWLAHSRQIETKKLEPCLYIHHDEEAVKHILRVVSGLDSMVLGEPQILGQVKTSHSQALKYHATGSILNRLMQYSFTTAKKIRTQTAIGANPVSVAYAAVSLAKQIFAKLDKQTALLVGAGETIELVGRHLHSNGIGHMIVANRSVDKAQRLADEFGGEAITLEAIADRLHEADIVISSTAAPIPIIGKGSVERALKSRKHQPMFMVDIAVPRDIEPEVSALDDVYLYTVDDLQSVIEENMKSRQTAANQAEQMVTQEVSTYMDWLRAQSQLQLLCQYRAHSESLKEETLEKALRLFRNGKSAEDTLEFLAHTLTNKLSHAPTAAMNKAAHSGDLKLLKAARDLLNLKK